MDPQAVRERAEAYCEALVAGDIERSAEEMSRELRANLGTIVAILPLPLTGATVESVDMGGSGYVVMLALHGEGGDTTLQTRWKDRDGHPTMVEASHLAAVPAPEASTEAESEVGE